MGVQIHDLRNQLQQAVWRDDYEEAQRIKEKLARMEGQRDSFDVKYETSVFEDQLVVGSAAEAREQMRQQHELNVQRSESCKCFSE